MPKQSVKNKMKADGHVYFEILDLPPETPFPVDISSLTKVKVDDTITTTTIFLCVIFTPISTCKKYIIRIYSLHFHKFSFHFSSCTRTHSRVGGH